MTSRTKARPAAKPRRDVEAEITERVIAALEAGTVPWTKPWTSAAGAFPTSASTGRAYRGINVFLLTLTAWERGYGSPIWMTFKQATDLGGTVRKGEKGTLVVFWKLFEVKDEAAEDGTKRIPVLRHYVVFNHEQTEGVVLPPRFDRFAPAAAGEPVVVDEAVDAILAAYVDGPTYRHARQGRAFYSPVDDEVVLPELDQFESPERYASTLFHETIHSTGHASRLNRHERGGEPQHFGSERYAREELVAEMGAAMLSAHAGVEVVIEQSAAYVASWLEALRNDKSLVIRAAQQAQKAVDRVMGTAFEAEKEEAA